MNDYNERLLKNVLDDYCEEQDKEFLKEIEDANDDSRFAHSSEKDAAFEKFLNKATKKAKRKNRLKKNFVRVASVFLAVCIGFTVMTYTVKGFKERVWFFFANLGSQTHFSLHTSTDDNEKQLDKYEGKYIPSWIPEEYKVDTVENSNGMYVINMSNKDKILSFTENDTDAKLNVDNEDVKSNNKYEINGNDAIIVNKNGVRYLTMKVGDSLIYIMTTDSQLDIKGFAELIEEK